MSAPPSFGTFHAKPASFWRLNERREHDPFAASGDSPQPASTAVGVGASAGGIEALEAFFASACEATGIAIDGIRQGLQHVLKTGTSEEHRVARKDGTAHYLIRIIPYQGQQEESGGVLVT